MTPRKFEARQGVQWMLRAIQLMASNPKLFLSMGLLLTVLGALPLLGVIIVFVLGPAFNGGIMLAAREQMAGRPARLDMLWAALRQPGKLPSMMVLCLPALLAALIGIAFLLTFHPDAIQAVAAAAELSQEIDPRQLAELGQAVPVFLLLALLAYAVVFFAVPRVMLDSTPPLVAMAESLSACARNAGGIFMLILTALALTLTLIVLTAWLPLLMQLLLGAVMTPLLAMANVNAYLDVFGDDQSEVGRGGTPTIEA